MTLKTKMYLRLHCFFHKIDQWFINHCDYERHARVIGVKIPPYPIPSRPTPSKPTKAVHQDTSKFMEGKSKIAPWYRKSIKKKLKPEE